MESVVTGALIGLFILWIWMCLVLNEEGRHKNITMFGRFLRTISGVADRIYDKKTKRLINGINKNLFTWIWWPFQKVDIYEFEWVEPRKSSEVTEGDKHIVGGNPKKDTEISFHRKEITNHHRDEYNYRFEVKRLETGETEQAMLEKKNLKAGVNPENIKIDASIQATVKMDSPFEARYRNSGKWHSSLQAAIFGTLGEVISKMIYADLANIRGEKLSNYPVVNTEPFEQTLIKDGTKVFYYADSSGKRKETITFLDRINYEILFVQRLGVYLINITLIDYDINEESRGFVDALQLNATSKINLNTADNNAQALDKQLQVKKGVAIDIINANKEAQKDLMQTENLTVVKKAAAQPNLRVLIEGQQGPGAVQPVNVNDIINTTLALDAADEIRDATKDEGEKSKKGGHKK